MLMAMTRELAIFDDVDEADDAAAVAEGLTDIDANRIISHNAMKAWLLSWGMPNELPSPKIGD
jgi:predicted transcriptional regulator